MEDVEKTMGREKKDCYAFNKECRKCHRLHHFEKFCLTKTTTYQDRNSRPRWFGERRPYDPYQEEIDPYSEDSRERNFNNGKEIFTIIDYKDKSEKG